MKTSITSITQLNDYPCFWVTVKIESTGKGSKPSLELKVAVPSDKKLTFEEIEQQAKIKAKELLTDCITHLD